MFERPGLAVSLPVNELTQVPPPGSVFDVDDIDRTLLSGELQVAVSLIAESCRVNKLCLRFVTRPEIFTSSASLVWLQHRLNGIRNHVCITDGMTVRVIPEMRNHMFLYRLGTQANSESFARLLRRAPELIATLQGQVNTAFTAKVDQRRSGPPTIILPGLPDRPRDPPQFFRFLVDKRSAAQSARTIMASAPLKDPIASPTIVYLPMTEVSARDRLFAEIVGGFILRAYLDPNQVIIIRLPFLAVPSPPIEERITVALAGLCTIRSSLPRTFTDNVLFASEDLPDTFLNDPAHDLHIVAHQTFEFWRHSPAIYHACKTVTVHADWRLRHDRAGIRRMLAELLGRPPDLRWLPFDEWREG